MNPAEIENIVGQVTAGSCWGSSPKTPSGLPEQPLTAQAQAFDYAALNSETRIVVQQRTSEIKQRLRDAAQAIWEIGQKLVDVRNRLEHGQFNSWLKAEFQWSRRKAYNYINVFESFGNCANVAQLKIATSALYLLAAPSTPDSARHEALERATQGEAVTHTKAKAIVSQHKEAGKTVALEGDVGEATNTEEHYTPQHILDAVLACLGEIDLDPCSNSHYSPNVPARQHLTAEDDGLAHPWHGRVFMNPPYGNAVKDWVEKLCFEFECSNVTEALALVASCTDTQWFRRLRQYPRCFITSRLRFSATDNSAPFPSVVFYLGRGQEGFQRFVEAFNTLGDIFALVESGTG